MRSIWICHLLPTCAPNLWGHPFWGCLNYHVPNMQFPLETLTLMGIRGFQDSFTRVTLSCAIHTTRMGTLWLRLPPTSRRFTDSWCVFWDPPLWSNSVVWITDARCHIGLTLLPRTRRHILVINIRPLIEILARAACGSLVDAACGTQLIWPTITSSQQCPRTGRYTSSPVSSC